MAKTEVIVMAGIAFSVGLLLGLVVHLPGVSSPLKRGDGGKAGHPSIEADIRRLVSARFPGTGTDNVTGRLTGNQRPGIDLFHRTRFGPAGVSAGGNYTDTRRNATHWNETSGSDDTVFSRIIVDGVFWSNEIEAMAPDRFSDADVARWRRKTEAARVVTLDAGCGMMQNRHLVFDDATHACARYRINADQIQGDVFSFYLSRLLGVGHVPPAVLATTKRRRHLWSGVDSQLVAAQWSSGRAFVLTPWVPGLEPAFIPPDLRRDNRTLHPTPAAMENKTHGELVELLQWSDLIVFDYLTANVDRVVNNMFNKQWNDHMMDSPTHNLERSAPSGLLVFLDNESGLFHSYRLLDKYAHYHDSLLGSLCVFRRQTALRVQTLYRDGDVGTKLVELFENHEPLHSEIPTIPAENMQMLHRRLGDVHRQILKCQRTFHS
ncbi:hypothetical protein NP493_337g02020 [Ridgeia piscesae]|uniref:Uncharacterized protein n=1 Tax=Ridgeia piscesae TaxID=27915 RepID=A0AAD9NWA3_RIDPI|nr:hypothetical protein NP493_337g02020 [Ridgeia piscesae]